MFEYVTDSSDEDVPFTSYPSKKLKLESTDDGTPRWISKYATTSKNQADHAIEISDSEDGASSIIISECSDSDFEVRVRKRKRGSSTKKFIEGSVGRRILQNYQQARSAGNTSTYQQGNISAGNASTFQPANRSAGTTSTYQQGNRSAGNTSSFQQANSSAKIPIYQRKENEQSQLESSEDDHEIEIVLDSVNDKQIVIHKQVAKHLKPHQVEGVKHMYDCCYKIGHNAKEQGSGCILAHCMGLGKTFQLIALLHTVINYPEFQTNRILILCPKSTISNWKAEIKKWIGTIKNSRCLNMYEFTDTCQNSKQIYKLNAYSKHNAKYTNAACFIMGYETFRSLVFYGGEKKKSLSSNETRIRNTVKRELLDATDLIVCDEGHMIKSLKSQTNRAVTRIKTKRRIVLTGTPVQNNLMEYYAMVDFVKPSLLGTADQFRYTYANPIAKGQHKDSSRQEIKSMRLQSYNLNRELKSFVHRREVSLLLKDLPEKYEYVLYIPMSEKQYNIYDYYLKENPYQFNSKKLFADYTTMRKIWTHLKHLELSYENAVKKNGKVEAKCNQNRNEYEADDESDDNEEATVDTSVTQNWWKPFVTEEDMTNILESPKFQVLFEILSECHRLEEKCLIFSSSVVCLDVVEYFLGLYHEWKTNVDYFRLDGSTKNDKRHEMIVEFNKPQNKRVKLFLISAKAGGQGINLTGANRVILLDTSWNPSVDQQSIFRIFRFGQVKKCYIYRLLSMGTMEEKVYSRSVTKQAMSFRVLDKQQIDRNYSMAELEELYTLTKPDMSERKIPIPPKDELLAHLLNKFPDKVYKYHEHNSLLDNKIEEDMTEEEKQEALMLFEQNKLRNELMNLAKNGTSNPGGSGLGPGVASTSNAAVQLMRAADASFEISQQPIGVPGPAVASTSRATLQSAQNSYLSYAMIRPQTSQQPNAKQNNFDVVKQTIPKNSQLANYDKFLGKKDISQNQSNMRNYFGQFMELEE